MAKYLQLVLKLNSKIFLCDFKWVRKSKSNHADSLLNLGATMELQFRREIPVKHITNPSLQQAAGVVLRLDISPG